MARELQRAFTTSLAMTQTPQAEQVDWEKLQKEMDDPDFVPELFPPTDTLEFLDEPLDEVTAYATLIDALQDAQTAGFDSDTTRSLASRLSGTNIRDLPSMEAFCDFPANAAEVSMEALRNSIKETLKAILQALARFWAALMDMVQGWLESSKLLRARVMMTQGNLRAIAGRSPVQASVSDGYVAWLSTDKVKADNPRNVGINLEILSHQIALVRLNYLPMVNGLTQKFIGQFEKWQGGQWDGVDTSQWLEGLNLLALEYKPAEALGAKHAYGDRNSPNWRSDVTMTDCLPGYRWIVVVPPPQVDGSYPALAKSTALQSTRVLVEEVYPRQRSTSDKDTPVFTVSQLEKILDQTMDVVKEIEALTHSDARRALREMTLRLDRMANSNLTVPDGSVSIFQAGVAYARTISRWAKDPYQGVVLHALNVCNNSVRMCNMHMRAYKPAPLPKETQP